MLAECAICLAKGEASGEGIMEGGVLTPSVAMGRSLVRRLERTGRFKVRREKEKESRAERERERESERERER